MGGVQRGPTQRRRAIAKNVEKILLRAVEHTHPAALPQFGLGGVEGLSPPGSE
jgi:hypothetical protein